MKLLVVLLIAISGLLFLDRNATQKKLEKLEELSNSAKVTERINKLQKDLHKAQDERDDARAIARDAHREIARLTKTEPPAESWLTERLEKSTGRLDNPSNPVPYSRRSSYRTATPRPSY